MSEICPVCGCRMSLQYMRIANCSDGGKRFVIDVVCLQCQTPLISHQTDGHEDGDVYAQK